MTIQANFPNVQPSLLLDFANAKQLPPSVTFTRATTATYYDGSTTALAEQNLLLYSQAFDDSSWSKANSNITANSTTAPDGTTTADTLTPTANNGIHEIIPSSFTTTVNGSAYAISIFAKKDGGSFIQILVANQSSDFANFDLNAGTVGTTGGSITAAIQNIGSGWYRCSMIFTAGGTDRQPRFDIVDSASASRRPTWTAAGTETVFLWGAQVEQRSSVTAYTATTTQAITNYIPVLLTAGGGQPRFDHNPTTSESLGLLIEEQRTNAFNYSADLGTSPWTVSSVTVSGNTIIAPDGTLTGDKIIPDATNNVHYIRQIVGSSANYTFSCYFKAAEYSTVVMLGVSANHGAAFNLANGTVSATYGSATAAITAVGNGWYRCSTSLSVSGTDFYIYVNTASTYVGNAFGGIYAWGAQLEVGAFPTSYIPTSGAAATRAADVVSMSGANFSSWYSPGNGTFYAEASTASVASDVMIAEGTNSAGSFLDFSMTFATTGTQFINRFVASNNDMRRTGVVAVNTMVKFSGSITNSSGTTLASTNGVTAPAVGTQGANFGADRMFIGSRGGSSLFINAPIRKLAFYPAQLTQTQQNSITG